MSIFLSFEPGLERYGIVAVAFQSTTENEPGKGVIKLLTEFGGKGGMSCQ